MSEPDLTQLSDEETQALVDYARRKFGVRRWPTSLGLRHVREVIEKLDPKAAPEPLPAPEKRVEPSWRMARKRRRGAVRQQRILFENK